MAFTPYWGNDHGWQRLLQTWPLSERQEAFEEVPKYSPGFAGILEKLWAGISWVLNGPRQLIGSQQGVTLIALLLAALALLVVLMTMRRHEERTNARYLGHTRVLTLVVVFFGAMYYISHMPYAPPPPLIKIRKSMIVTLIAGGVLLVVWGFIREKFDMTLLDRNERVDNLIYTFTNMWPERKEAREETKGVEEGACKVTPDDASHGLQGTAGEQVDEDAKAVTHDQEDEAGEDQEDETGEGEEAQQAMEQS